MGEIGELLADVLFEHHLGDAGAIAQVDEHRAAVIAAVVDPSEEDHFASHVPRGELAARVRALQLADEFRHGASDTGCGLSGAGSVTRARKIGNWTSTGHGVGCCSLSDPAVGFPVAQVSRCHGSLLSFRPDYLRAAPRSRAPPSGPVGATVERTGSSGPAGASGGDVSRADAARRGRSPGRQGGKRARRKEGPEWESAFPREEGVRAQAEANGGGDERRPLRLPACTIASLRLRKPHGFFDPDGVGGGE